MIVTMPHVLRSEFEAAALPHMPALYHMAMKMTRRPQQAEDLVQDTLLRAYRAFDTFEQGTNARAWLFRILRNVHINNYRSARVRPEDVDFAALEGIAESAIDTIALPAEQIRTPEDAVMENVIASEVSEAMDALPAEFRSVVEMALIEELSYREIADTLGIPVGTVMSRLHRGRRILQTRLHAYATQRGIVGRRTAAADSRQVA